MAEHGPCIGLSPGPNPHNGGAHEYYPSLMAGLWVSINFFADPDSSVFLKPDLDVLYSCFLNAKSVSSFKKLRCDYLNLLKLTPPHQYRKKQKNLLKSKKP